MSRIQFKNDNIFLHLLAIIVITFFYYHESLNNFFYADDFIWLNRVKYLQGNWSNIFSIEHTYFTPLTYLSFFVNYKIFGLNPYWYHLHDVLLHSLNGILIYILTYQLTRSRLASIISAILFVTSFSSLMTVLWSSARTDLVMLFFSLATLVVFNKTAGNNYRFIPIILYILALGAKGTALVIPVVLFLLTAHCENLWKRFRLVLPYVAVNMVYVSLLATVTKLYYYNGTPSQNNYVKALPTLIVPERHLAGLDPFVLAIICCAILFVLIGIAVRLRDLPTRVATVVTVIGLLPLLYSGKYALVGNTASAFPLLASPSNRVYLATAGISLIYAIIFEKMFNNSKSASVKILSGTLLILLLVVNYKEINIRQTAWSKGTGATRSDVTMLQRNASMLTEDSELLLFNFEGSPGFSRAMINSYYDIKKYGVYNFDLRYLEEYTDTDLSPLNDPGIVQKSDKFRIILGCSGYPNIDMVTQEANILLQTILSGYRELYATTSSAEAQHVRNKIDEKMGRLGTILSMCSCLQNT